MWTFINSEHLESYLNKYPQLAENFDDIKLYEVQNRIFLPRLFYLNFPSEHLQIFDNTSSPFESVPTFFKFTGKLREEQVPIVNTILTNFAKNKSVNGIIKARPGLGCVK